MKKGFTLLELLIVVVIIGILALIAAPSLLNATDQAKEGAVKANVSAAASSVTSRFALNSNDSATTVAGDIVTKLNNEDENVNPVEETNPAFTTGAAAAGSVVLVPDEVNNQIEILGYGKDVTTPIVRKIVAAPADNT